MKDSITKFLIGGAGFGATELIEQTLVVNPETINSAVGLIGQLVIIVATIISLFKRKKTP